MHLRQKSLTAAAAVTVAVVILGGTATAAAPQPAQSASAAAAAAEPPVVQATEVDRFDAFDANQGIAVDRSHFYAVDNRTITKHDRTTGEPLLQFVGETDGGFEHLDSGLVVGHQLYAAHSNFSEWPMESSIEVFDTRTMKHTGTHSFGIYRGSLTWLDRYDGAWWAGFANYDRIEDGEPYGKTYNTQIVKLDNDFTVVESWTIPKQILDKFDVMSNSGGSWGPDGKLYLSGHDLPEAYVMELPVAGGELEWVGTVGLPGIHGQGIAWDRSTKRNPTLWGISRPDKQAIAYSIPTSDIGDADPRPWTVVGPGDFR